MRTRIISMLIFRFIILFWVTTILGLHPLTLKNGPWLSLPCSVLTTVSLRPPHLVSSDWSAHTQLSLYANNNRATVLNQFLAVKLGINDDKWPYLTKSWSSQGNWRGVSGTSIGANIQHFNLQDLLHTQEPINKLRDGKKAYIGHIWGPITRECVVFTVK